MTWRGRHIYLVGLPGAGKTSIGIELGKLLEQNGYIFADLDRAVEQSANKQIAAIFEQRNGEAEFRKLESKVLHELSESKEYKVVAVGSGAVLNPVNRAIMRGSGLIVWIDVTVRQASKNVLQSTLQGFFRPLLRADTLEALAEKIRVLGEERRKYFEKATLHFVTRSPRGDERTPKELAEELFKALDEMSKRVMLLPRFRIRTAKSATCNYPILIGSGIVQKELVHTIEDLSLQRVLVLTDDTVRDLHTDGLIRSIQQEVKSVAIETLSIAPGEQSKNFDEAIRIVTQMFNKDFSRKNSALVTVGGGTVSDLGGLAACLYKRGITLIHIPTTMLAQCDAAIGGKTGVNFGAVKNGLGTFYPPHAVIIDPLFLRTLPKRELHAGLAELFKYALIGSNDLWQQLSKSVRRLIRGVDASYEPFIRQAVEEKLRYVESDEFELKNGERELLNFGHTFAHAIESATGFAVFLHGEAVTLGMRAAAWLSHEMNYLSEEDWKEIEVTLGRIPVKPSLDVSREQILHAFGYDKKKQVDGLRFILLRQIGDAFVADSVPQDKVIAATEFLLSIG